jgi:hypothetical protein
MTREGIELKHETPLGRVTIENVNMPFTAMVGLVIKFWLATIMAAIVLVVLGGIGFVMALAILGAGRH